jgi:splicing factor 45
MITKNATDEAAAIPRAKAVALRVNDPRKPVRSKIEANRLVYSLLSTGRFEESFDHWSREDDERPRGLGSGRAGGPAAPAVTPVPVATDRNLSGEEAFKRRLAMSAGVKPASPPAFSPPLKEVLDDDEHGEPISESVPQFAPAPPPSSETGDEAYLRRVALSHSRSTHPPAPSAPAVAPPSPPTLAYNPFAPPSVPPPPSGPPPVISGLEEKVKAAASIAARLGALAAMAPSGSEPSPAAPHTSEPSASSRYAVFSKFFIVKGGR